MESPQTFRVDPALERQQVERLRELRSSRSGSAVHSALASLENAARGAENLMPRILEPCRALATLGEISDMLRKVFGEYRDIT